MVRQIISALISIVSVFVSAASVIVLFVVFYNAHDYSIEAFMAYTLIPCALIFASIGRMVYLDILDKYKA